MAVSCIEQRHLPLVESQPVWQPWGPAGPYPLDDDEEGPDFAADKILGSSMRRSHSWSGYAPFALRRHFGEEDDAALDEGHGLDLRINKAYGESGQLDEDDSQMEVRKVQDADGELCCACGAHLVIPEAWSTTSGHMMHDVARQLSSSSAATPPSAWSTTSGQMMHDLARQLSSSSAATPPSDLTSETSSAGQDSESQQPWIFSALFEQGGVLPVPETGSLSDNAGVDTEENGNSQASDEVAPMEITTLMVQNLPYKLSREEFLAELDRCGYADTYNFCHVPRTFTTGKNQGVAFVNFLSQDVAERFSQEWHGNRSLLGLSPFSKALRVKVATVQGIRACEKMAQSRRMRRVKTGTFKPQFMVRVPPKGSA